MKKQLQTKFSERQYMKEPEFEIYYYNDPHLLPVEVHSHAHYEFYFFLEGNIEMVVENMVNRPSAGDMLLIPPGVIHFPRSRKDKERKTGEKPYRRIVLWVQESFLEKIFLESEDYGWIFEEVKRSKKYLFTFDSIQANRIQGMAFEMIEETWGNRYGKAAALSLQLKRILLELNRLLYERKHKKKMAEYKTYQVICDFISNHLDEDLSLNRLSKEFFLNKYYIAHLFKEKVGISAHQYITKKRLEVCKNALLSEGPIGEICRQYGFPDYTSFYRGFRKEYGLSPKEYRKSHQLE